MKKLVLMVLLMASVNASAESFNRLPERQVEVRTRLIKESLPLLYRRFSEESNSKTFAGRSDSISKQEKIYEVLEGIKSEPKKYGSLFDPQIEATDLGLEGHYRLIKADCDDLWKEGEDRRETKADLALKCLAISGFDQTTLAGFVFPKVLAGDKESLGSSGVDRIQELFVKTSEVCLPLFSFTDGPDETDEPLSARMLELQYACWAWNGVFKAITGESLIRLANPKIYRQSSWEETEGDGSMEKLRKALMNLRPSDDIR